MLLFISFISSDFQVFFAILLVIVLYKLIINWHEKSRKSVIYVSDNCMECPFKREVDLNKNEVVYKCSIDSTSKSFDSWKDMNSQCQFGSKIEINIKKQ